jgi:hypothetical protein
LNLLTYVGSKSLITFGMASPFYIFPVILLLLHEDKITSKIRKTFTKNIAGTIDRFKGAKNENAHLANYGKTWQEFI